MPVNIKTVLICDPVHETCVDLLTKNGIKAEYKGKLTKEQLYEEVKKVDGLIIRSETKVTKEVIEAANGSLKVIGRAGVGIDNVDVEAATLNKIIVLK
jgi:phosphoglycerate dehydrogenase-like enzyme